MATAPEAQRHTVAIRNAEPRIALRFPGKVGHAWCKTARMLDIDIGERIKRARGGLAINEYYAARDLNPSVFAELFGRAFFVHFGPTPEPLRRVMTETTREVQLGERWSTPPRLLVHAVRERRGGFVTIGRADTNEVIIDDLSVSKHHSVIVSEAGFVLRDLGSTNGTFIDEHEVGNVGEKLAAGSQVRFGNVSALYVDAAAFHRLVVRMS